MTMKFVCTMILDTEIAAGMTPEDWKAFDREAMASNERLRQSGHYVTSAELQGADTARTVRVRGGRQMVTDGPFMETKEQLAGFLVLEAKDAEEALALVREGGFPRIGAVEIRPMMKLGE